MELELEGESIDISSLIELALGRNEGGGGVLLIPSKVSQNSFPLELRIACCLKLLESLSPCGVSPTINISSGISSRDSCAFDTLGMRLGEECVAFVDERILREGWRSESDSRTCRTTSASRRNSVSIGAPSSRSAARTRANPFVFG